ncbi:hypothetical protein RHSIM_Rhsim06G0030100 [Rhododendron simsii]|uniref:DUF4408 domain-containing protein n=1 Tax=Rhododendron simsii TaxID=118357 RepID=A0A834GWJ3_RHOSS|nr:hypothetical protein RHSIM_Rhsim06G0030100 [Rhododendron simsii]
MDCLNIQAEKATAMMRYRRLRNITKMRRLLEILVALAFFSWSSTRLPSVLTLAAQFLVRVYEYLVNPHITFVIGNAIIVVVVFLSRQNNAGNAAAAFDFSDEMVPTTPPTLAAETEEIEADRETACFDKEIVVSENVVGEVQCDAVSAAIEEGEKVIRRSNRSFERTKSEKLTRRESQRSAPGRILRRSETVVVSSSERVITSFDTVDKLSNEEFRRTIEDVIAEHRRCLWAQKTNENE